MNTTPQKLRGIIEIFVEALHKPVGNSIKVSQPNNESCLTELEYECPVALDMFWKLVKEDIQDIATYIQQLSTAQELHSEDIKLLLKAVTKHFL